MRIITPDDERADRLGEAERRAFVKHGCCILAFSRDLGEVNRTGNVITLRCPTCGRQVEQMEEL